MTDRFDWKVTIDAVDVTQFVVANGTIDHGRGSVFSGFSAPRAVFELFTEEGWPAHPGTLPTIEPGDAVVITVTDLEHAVPYEHGRFTGKVQALEWSEFRLRVIAVGTIADWQHSLAFVPLESFPPQKDDVRVPAWCAQSSPTQSITVEGGGGRWLRAIDYGQAPEPLLDVLLAIAEDCDALLMQDRFGTVRYRTRYRTAPARETLPSAVIDKTSIDMVLEHGTLRNTVYVYYGPDPQDSVEEADAASVSTYGVRADTLTTQLRFEAGARGKAATYMEQSQNRWAVPDVTMAMALTDDTAYDLLISLEEGDPITLDDLPAGAPIASYDANIVGFTEIMSPTDYQMILHLSYGLESTGEDDGNWTEYGNITGGDETGTYTVDGLEWAWHKFTSGGDLTIAAGVSVVGRLLGVGGGGGGTPSGTGVNSASGGGGAGDLYEDSEFVLQTSDSPITITIGAGGIANYSGDDTVIDYASDTLTLTGGGNGAYDTTGGGGYAAANGGSGGGGGASQAAGTGTGGTGGIPANHFHSDGQGGSGITGGNGGGAAPGANGRVSDITGTSVRYGMGGVGGRNSLAYTPAANTGSGGNGGAGVGGAGTAGKDGVVIFAYRISPGGGDGSYEYDSTFPYDLPITYE